MSESGSPFREYAIPPSLSPFVKSIWSFEDRATIYGKARERILPDACVELVIHFRDPFRNYFADGTANLQPGSFVVGQMKRFLEIEPCQASGFVAVRFHARGAYLFLRSPLTEITNSVVPLKEIWNSRANEYSERVALARRMPARVRVVEEMLLEALRENGKRDCAIERGVQLIQNATESISITGLASTLGLSSRQLTRRFQNAIGMTPKEFVRVNRFIRAARRMREHSDSSLTETAYECAYFDQAHFNHEFREFAGMTPGEFIVAKNVAV
jgi:AraC-like DNA-binding protein